MGGLWVLALVHSFVMMQSIGLDFGAYDAGLAGQEDALDFTEVGGAAEVYRGDGVAEDGSAGEAVFYHDKGAVAVLLDEFLAEAFNLAVSF